MDYEVTVVRKRMGNSQKRPGLPRPVRILGAMAAETRETRETREAASPCPLETPLLPVVPLILRNALAHQRETKAVARIALSMKPRDTTE